MEFYSIQNVLVNTGFCSNILFERHLQNGCLQTSVAILLIEQCLCDRTRV